MPKYLERKASEVLNMFDMEYDYDVDVEVQKEEAREAGRAEGLMDGIKSDILKLMQKLKMSVYQAMDFLDIPASEQPKYAAMIQQA